MLNPVKKTPTDSSEFEREQLRFFLSNGDATVVLTDVNPSLAWLPIIVESRLTDAELAPWIEKNFSDEEAVTEVAANIRIFGADVADILEARLNRTEGLSPVLTTCWRLIVRHMRNNRRGALRSDWFDIAPRIKRGEQSPVLLEQIANALRPKVRVGKQPFRHASDAVEEAQRPSDLMSIDYEIDAGITDDEVLSAWPDDASAQADDKLLKLLFHALEAALEEAIEAGVESDLEYGVSESDVPSIDAHQQNAYHAGFLPVVRVIAELWRRLARKGVERALDFVDSWRESPLRLVRRLALFASADPAVPAEMAARVLTTVPVAELFVTNSTVEVHRLLLSRWNDFAPADRAAIELVICQGPPRSLFVDEQEQIVDRCRFDLLGQIERTGGVLGSNARSFLDYIHERWPEWELTPVERAGFRYWHGGGSAIAGDAAELRNVPDDSLVSAAAIAAQGADFMDSNAWQALCQSDPARALRGIVAQAAVGQWPTWAWRPFLWAADKLQDSESVNQVARLLLDWPEDTFFEIAAEASWWLNQAAKALDESLLWQLWDRTFSSLIRASEHE